MLSPLLESLVKALSALPGIGRKTAQRLAIHLVSLRPEVAIELSLALSAAVDQIGKCQCCRNLTEQSLCSICADPKRDEKLICIVESPMDVLAIESAGGYRGRYFVLYGRLSPIDGIGPGQLGLNDLETLVNTSGIEEVILATNLTVEGEATAHFISDRVKALGASVSRIAHGVPTGGELEFIDSQTLGFAIQGRASY
jgi:recombination protein RecR|tara:strand:+ start:39462 stop:40055 length:594 start_codon:yes stop_codon:yes gene_type:complete